MSIAKMERGQIPYGYKKTEVGIIPEDWEVKKLGEVGITYGGLTGKKKEDFGTGNSYYIPFLNILMNIIVDTKKLEKVYIKENETQNKVKKGDLFFNTSSETPEEVGMCAVLNEDLEDTYLNSFCFGYRLKDNNIDELFLSNFINSEYGRKIFINIAQGATRYNLSKQHFNNIEIIFPPTLEEQRDIAQVLSDFDNLIESLDKLIEKNKLIKKGAMQELLTGKKRLPGFTGKWMKKKLGDIFTITRGYVLSVDKMSKVKVGKYKYPVYSSQTQNNGIIGYYFDFLYENAITWTTDGANAGDVKFRKGKFYCTNVCGVLLNNQGFSNRCIAGIFGMNSEKYVSYVGNPKLMNNVVKNIEITFPQTIEEQLTIAEILSDMDAEIDALEKKKKKYEMLKKGAMEMLLTGKIRLVNH